VSSQKLCCCLALALLVCPLLNGQNIPANPQSAFVLPIVKRDSLLNGLQLIVLEQKGSGSASVHLRVNSGAVFDLAGKAGLADITGGMLLRGGGGISAKNVADLVETTGLRVSMNVGWDSSDLVISGPADSLETIFDLISRLVVNPAFEQKELDDLKTARIAALKQDSNDADVTIDRALEAVYGSHPFGHRLRGSPASVAAITRNDLQFFHSRYYLANNSELTVSGDTTAESVTRLGRAKLGAWKKGETIAPTFRAPEPITARRVLLSDRSDSNIAYVAICQQGFSRRAEDFFAASVMMNVLRQSVSKQAASENGASVDFCCPPQVIGGPIIISIKCDPGMVQALIDSTLRSMSVLQESPPSTSDVEAGKAKLSTVLGDRLKTPDGAAEVILDIGTYGLGRDYLITFADRLAAIAPSDVTAAARAHLHPQALVIAVTGPAAKLAAQLQKFGSVSPVK